MSPMPFGSESMSDPERWWLDHLGLTALSPMPFGSESMSDRFLKNIEFCEAMRRSPMPFGSESMSDSRQNPSGFRGGNRVTNAFRQ